MAIETNYPAGYAGHTSHCNRSLSWGAIFAGAVAALSLHILMMMLGAGLGLAIYNPINDDNPVAELATGAVIIQGVSAVISLWFGGWIAGRFTSRSGRHTGRLHGFMVWCVSTVAGIFVVSTGAGWALGDLSKLVGGGLSMAGKPLAAAVSGAGDMAKGELERTSGSVKSFVDEALSNRSGSADDASGIRAKREVGLTVARLFAPHEEANMANNRAAAVKALVDNTGMSQAEADRTVNEWTESYQNLKADLQAAKDAAEVKAKELAEKSAKALAMFSLCTFVGFVLGAISAAMGGKHGALQATRCDVVTVA